MTKSVKCFIYISCFFLSLMYFTSAAADFKVLINSDRMDEMMIDDNGNISRHKIKNIYMFYDRFWQDGQTVKVIKRVDDSFLFEEFLIQYVGYGQMEYDEYVNQLLDSGDISDDNLVFSDDSIDTHILICGDKNTLTVMNEIDVCSGDCVTSYNTEEPKCITILGIGH